MVDYIYTSSFFITMDCDNPFLLKRTNSWILYPRVMQSVNPSAPFGEFKQITTFDGNMAILAWHIVISI